MADDPELTARFPRLLDGAPDVVEQRMFGSVDLMVGGVLRVGVGRHDDHVMTGRIGLAEDEGLERRVASAPAAEV